MDDHHPDWVFFCIARALKILLAIPVRLRLQVDGSSTIKSYTTLYKSIKAFEVSVSTETRERCRGRWRYCSNLDVLAVSKRHGGHDSVYTASERWSKGIMHKTSSCLRADSGTHTQLSVFINAVYERSNADASLSGGTSKWTIEFY